MRFFAELRNPQNTLSVIISVIEGLSFVRVKMYPVEELEGWLVFLQVMITFIYYFEEVHMYMYMCCIGWFKVFLSFE